MKTEPSSFNPVRIDRNTIEYLCDQYEEKGGLSAAFEEAGLLNGWSPVTATYISDNGGGPDLAAGEIRKRIRDINVVLATLNAQSPPQNLYHDIPPQDWIAGAFDLAQLARDTVRGPGNCIFINCAPRLQQRGKETANKGEDVYVGMLPNGTVVSGVGAHSFAFFKDLVETGELEIYKVNVQTEGSQFRSRDFFPWFSQILAFSLGAAHQGWKSKLDVKARKEFLQQFNFIQTNETLDVANIPDLQIDPVVARADVHGNLKLSISRSDLPDEWLGQTLLVTVPGAEPFEAVLREHMFDNNTQSQGIAPGSSGNWPDSSKEDPRFLELALMGRSLREDLGITDQQLKEGLRVELILAGDCQARKGPRRIVETGKEAAPFVVG